MLLAIIHHVLGVQRRRMPSFAKLANTSVCRVMWLAIFFPALMCALVSACLYTIIYIFVACVPFLRKICVCLSKFIEMPYACIDNSINGRNFYDGYLYIIA